jgi:hypothetical protein
MAGALWLANGALFAFAYAAREQAARGQHTLTDNMNELSTLDPWQERVGWRLFQSDSSTQRDCDQHLAEPLAGRQIAFDESGRLRPLSQRQRRQYTGALRIPRAATRVAEQCPAAIGQATTCLQSLVCLISLN